MDTPVTERMCKTRHDNISSIAEATKDEVIKLRILWTGNGKIGASQKISMMWEEYQHKKQTSQGWIDWSFRVFISILISFIAIKLGLK